MRLINQKKNSYWSEGDRWTLRQPFKGGEMCVCWGWRGRWRRVFLCFWVLVGRCVVCTCDNWSCQTCSCRTGVVVLFLQVPFDCIDLQVDLIMYVNQTSCTHTHADTNDWMHTHINEQRNTHTHTWSDTEKNPKARYHPHQPQVRKGNRQWWLNLLMFYKWPSLSVLKAQSSRVRLPQPFHTCCHHKNISYSPGHNRRLEVVLLWLCVSGLKCAK